MKLAIVNLVGTADFCKLDELQEFVGTDDFMVAILFEEDVLKAQNIQTLMKTKFNKEMLDMRVIASDVGTVEQFAVVFSSVKTNRLTFQSVRTIEDLESILKLQIIKNNYTYKYI